MDDVYKPLLEKGYVWVVIVALLMPHCIALIVVIGNIIQRRREGPKPLTANERQLYNLIRDDVKPLISNVSTLADRVSILISQNR